MVIFHSYVSLPEGKSTYVNILGKWSNDALQLTRTPAHCPSHWLPNHCSSATPITAGVRSLDSTGGDNMWQPMITGVFHRNRKFISSLFFNVFHLRKGFRFSKDQFSSFKLCFLCCPWSHLKYSAALSHISSQESAVITAWTRGTGALSQGISCWCWWKWKSSSIWQLKRIQKPKDIFKNHKTSINIKHPFKYP